MSKTMKIMAYIDTGFNEMRFAGEVLTPGYEFVPMVLQADALAAQEAGIADLEHENRLLRARNERLEKEAHKLSEMIIKIRRGTGGWRLVPLKITIPMRNAWDSAPFSDNPDDEFDNAYRAMLEAAPTQGVAK